MDLYNGIVPETGNLMLSYPPMVEDSLENDFRKALDEDIYLAFVSFSLEEVEGIAEDSKEIWSGLLGHLADKGIDPSRIGAYDQEEVFKAIHSFIKEHVRYGEPGEHSEHESPARP